MVRSDSNTGRFLSFGRSVDKSYVYSISHNNQNVSLERKESFKDLGVIHDEKLTFRDHIYMIK